MVKKSIFIRKQIVISMNFVELLIICCLKVRPLWPLRNSVLSLYFVWNASSNCPKHDFHHIYFLHSEWIMMNIMVISFHSVLFTVYKLSMNGNKWPDTEERMKIKITVIIVFFMWGDNSPQDKTVRLCFPHWTIMDTHTIMLLFIGTLHYFLKHPPHDLWKTTLQT